LLIPFDVAWHHILGAEGGASMSRPVRSDEVPMEAYTHPMRNEAMWEGEEL
jgi:hypothetical protein